MKVHGSVDLGVIRETSKLEALETGSQFSMDESAAQMDLLTSEKVVMESKDKEAKPDPQTNRTPDVLTEKGSGSPSGSRTDSEGLLIVCEPHNSPADPQGSPSEMAPPHMETEQQHSSIGERDGKLQDSPDRQVWLFPSIHAHPVPSTTNEPLSTESGTSSVRSSVSPESTPASANKVGISHLLEQLDTQETDIVDMA